VIEQTLAQYVGVQPKQIARLMVRPQLEIYDDSEYKAWVSQLDAEQLYATPPHAREAYNQRMPHYSQFLGENYNLSNTKMSAFTLANWLVAFLQYPEYMRDMIKMHRRLPADAIAAVLPDMLESLQEMPDGGRDWQRALALLALPLLVSRD
jgi:hypothetical protein